MSDRKIRFDNDGWFERQVHAVQLSIVQPDELPGDFDWSSVTQP